METKQGQIKIVVDDQIAQGIYVNFANIFHSPTEVVLDFGRVVPGKPEVKILSRLIMTPHHAKRLIMALEDNLRKYESRFGSIRMDFEPPDSSMPS